MKGLTKRQRQIVDFVQEFIQRHHYSPSYREIQQHFGFSSVGSVFKHIQALKRKGIFSNEKDCSRSLSLNKSPSSPPGEGELELPFMGTVTLGGPIETFPQTGNIAIPASMVQEKEQSYVLEMQGKDLQGELMHPGDLIVVTARSEAAIGDVILAICYAHESIIKRFYPEGLYARLESLAANQKPDIVKQSDIHIYGVVTALLRLF